MSAPMEVDWPVADLDPVQRLRAVAAGLPHAVIDEAIIDAPIERVWGVMGDLERGAPQYELGVHSARIVSQDGERLELDVRTVLRTRMRYDVELRFGWCLMQSPASQIGMAATPADGGRTHVAHFEGSPLLGRLAKPYFRWNIRGDFRRIARLATNG